MIDKFEKYSKKKTHNSKRKKNIFHGIVDYLNEKSLEDNFTLIFKEAN